MEIEPHFEKRYRLVREVIETAVLTILMFLLIHFAVQNFNVDGFSMEPNLHNNELIFVDKWTYLFHAPTRGDVIVFVAPPDPSQDYVKRIIGLPGDVITINNGVPTVNGVTLKEYYVRSTNMGAAATDRPVNKEIVPPNDFFVMGDNRSESSDSRTWGFLPRQNIIGRAALIYWPLRQDNNGLLSNVSSVFTKVPQASTISPASSNSNGRNVFVLAMPGVFVIVSRYRKRRM